MVVIGCLLSHSFRTVIHAWLSTFVIFAVCSQQPWTSHVCHFDSCSTNYLQWRQLYSWYVGEIECMIIFLICGRDRMQNQLQSLVLYEVIRLCLEHPCHTSITNEFTTWTAFEGWGHGSSTVNVPMLRTQSQKNIIKISHSSWWS
jgi:hypothetical protein